MESIKNKTYQIPIEQHIQDCMIVMSFLRQYSHRSKCIGLRLGL